MRLCFKLFNDVVILYVNKINILSSLLQIKHNDVMKPGMRIHLPVSVAEGEIKKRYETIPTATLHPNKDEIEYLRRLVMHKVISRCWLTHDL